ncbi:unnamed protein product [Polarella glacialis]|uniref:Tudor domain-containing protein n=2 Tax=Polarella glacialis TaxID=89957 RepID=A0A813LMX4_POLGL|nr:unnamed protein product [Polarella glacialis]
MAEEELEVAGNEPGWTSEVDVGTADAAWLLEDGARRVAKFTRLAGAEAKVQEDGKVQLVGGEVGDGLGSRAWAEEVLQALCALRTGRCVTILRPLGDKATSSPSVSVVEVPSEDAKGYVMGKGGERLLKLSEEVGDAIAVLVEEKSAAAAESAEKEEVANEEDAAVKVGDLMEALYQGGKRWFEVRIESVTDEKVKVKWTYDEDVPEEELLLTDLRRKEEMQDAAPKKKEPARQALEVGAAVEGLYSNGKWFEAHVTAVLDGKVRVKWTYDDAVPESELTLADVKGKPTVEIDKVFIYGDDRARMTMELKILNFVEMKVKDFVASKPRVSDDCEGNGFSVIPLLNDGELKAKVIGKKGSVRLKIAKACGSELEYIGNLAYIVGTQAERARTAAILELIQTVPTGDLDSVPEVLEAMASLVTVHPEALPVVMGKQRATLNSMEDETGTMCFWKNNPVTESQTPEVELALTVGMTVEGEFESKKKGVEWFEATVLEIKHGEDGKHTVKVEWTYDPDEKSELPDSDVRKMLTVAEHKKREQLEAMASAKSLVILGPQRMRALAELRVMGLVEDKCPGTYASFAPIADDSGFVTEASTLADEEQKGIPEHRRKTIGAASNCIIEPVGDTLYLAGSFAERALAQEYLKWSTMEKPSVQNTEARDDIDVLVVTKDKLVNLTPRALGQVEEETETVAFFAADTPGGDSRLVVCGADEAKRASAVAKLVQLQEAPQEQDTKKRKWEDWGDGGKDWSKADGASKELQSAPPKKTKVLVFSSEDEERRRKRAERFGPRP